MYTNTYTDVQRTYHAEPAENLTFGPSLWVRCSTYNARVYFMSIQHADNSRSDEHYITSLSLS